MSGQGGPGTPLAGLRWGERKPRSIVGPGHIAYLHSRLKFSEFISLKVSFRVAVVSVLVDTMARKQSKKDQGANQAADKEVENAVGSGSENGDDEVAKPLDLVKFMVHDFRNHHRNDCR